MGHVLWGGYTEETPCFSWGPLASVCALGKGQVNRLTSTFRGHSSMARCAQGQSSGIKITRTLGFMKDLIRHKSEPGVVVDVFCVFGRLRLECVASQGCTVQAVTHIFNELTWWLYGTSLSTMDLRQSARRQCNGAGERGLCGSEGQCQLLRDAWETDGVTGELKGPGLCDWGRATDIAVG